MRDYTHVVMSQRVEPLQASFFLGGQVEVGQDLTRGARAPLCGHAGTKTGDQEQADFIPD